MFTHRLCGRSLTVLFGCLLAATTTRATAAHISGFVDLGGWVYIDRNNDGHLAFVDEPNPEFVIGGATIHLFSDVNGVETLLATALTDNSGRYLFENLAPGRFVLQQLQPVEYVDGLDTPGMLLSLTDPTVPAGSSPGAAFNNMFRDIVLPADVAGDFYNFGERGLAAGYTSKRLLFGSWQTPPSSPPSTPPTAEPATAIIALLAASGLGLIRIRRHG